MLSLEYLSVFCSGFVAVATLITHTINTHINQQAAYKQKATELFFEQKTTAYLNLVEVGTNFPPTPNQQDLQNIFSAVSRARLFASPRM